MADHTTITIISILLLPLVGGVFAYLVKRSWSGTVLSLFNGLILALSIYSFFTISGVQLFKWDWFTVGGHAMGFGLVHDRLSGIMLITVSIVSLLVSLFSIVYMKHDDAQKRYFGLLGFFVFSMFGIVLSSSLLMTFMFWELVGFSSYLLIGFWFEKEEPPIASFRAFMTNRIGDVGFLLALFICFAYFKTFDIQEIIALNSSSALPPYMVLLLGIGLFLAAVGKSAQFPLQTWLPHAMTGPTPVSALIHAATMVAAGVYFLIRVFPLLGIDVLSAIAIVGSITAFTGAYAAFAQRDIKKVLAFSTVSQLGYMMIAIGSGRPDVAFFHLATHAFFKAGLFLCAGSIIHQLHELHHGDADFDAQDMHNMGGLKGKMPFTFIAYSLCMLALCGIPFFSGFFSKEAIIASSFVGPGVHLIVPILAIATVFMTAAYMGRQYILVFFGKMNSETEGGKWSEPVLMSIPLLILATLSMWFWFGFNPFSGGGKWMMQELLYYPIQIPDFHEIWLPILSVGLALTGLATAYLIYFKAQTKLLQWIPNFWVRLSSNHWYLDEMQHFLVVNPINVLAGWAARFDKRIVDGMVNGFAVTNVVLAHIVGWFDHHIVDGTVTMLARISMRVGNMTRSIQGGKVQLYFVWGILGFLLIFILMI